MAYNPVNIAAAASNQTATSGTVVFANSNSVTFGMSNSSVVTASFAQSNQSLGLYATGNTNSTVGSNSTTLDARSITYDALGAATMGFSNSSIQVSVPNTSSLSGTGLVSIATNGQTISIGAAQTNQQMSIYATGNTVSSSSMTVNASSFDIAGSGIASVGAKGGSILISAGVATLSRLIAPSDQLTAVSAFGNGSLSVQYVPIDEYVTASRLDVLASWGAASTGNSNTMAIAITAIAGIYTLNASTLSSVSTGSTQTTYSYASNSAKWSSINSVLLPVSVPMNMNLVPAEYYVAFGFSTNSSSVGAATTNLVQTVSMYGGTAIQTALNYAEWLAGTNTSNNLYSGQGMFSTVTTVIPTTIGLANIKQTGPSILQANMALVFRNY